MKAIPMFLAALYVLFIIFLFLALIYVIIKRLEDRDKENFEDRDN